MNIDEMFTEFLYYIAISMHHNILEIMPLFLRYL